MVIQHLEDDLIIFIMKMLNNMGKEKEMKGKVYFKVLMMVLSMILLFSYVSARTINLKFDGKKQFKIVQFTDLHYVNGDSRSQLVLDNIHSVLNAEKPDLVVLTGDIVTGGSDRRIGLREVLEAISSHKVPFAVTFGNHDAEGNLTRPELLLEAQTFPYNLSSTTKGITGVTNYILPVMSSTGDHKTAASLYVFDSNTYYFDKEISNYDNIHFDQIAWYRENSTKYTKENNNVPIPSIAFFHIPLPEYNYAIADKHGYWTGTRKEWGGESLINSGLFSSFLDMKDMMATFVGHDHDNDYAIYFHGVLLTYGRFSGCMSTYNNLIPSGGRVIILAEGAKKFRTYVRLCTGEVINDVEYPDYFLPRK